MRMAQQHVRERLQLGPRIRRPGRVRRRVEDQPLGLRRDRRFQGFRRQLVVRVGPANDGDRFRPRQQHDLRIAHPVGRRDDHLVADVQRRDQRIEQHRLAARRDVHLGGLVGQPVLARELPAHRFLQLRNAVRGRVLGLALADRADGRFLDVLRRVEIRLARAEADHVEPLAFHLVRLGRHGNRGGRFHAGDGFGKLDVGGHGVLSLGWGRRRTHTGAPAAPQGAGAAPGRERFGFPRIETD